MANQRNKRMNKPRAQSIDDETNQLSQQIFPIRRPPTLGSIDSFILGPRYQGSYDNERPSVGNEGHGQAKPQITLTPADDLIRPSVDASDAVSLLSRVSRRTNRSQARKRKRRNATDENYDVHSQYYAGIGHSDLDIQTGRPPLMFQMNFVEWLWFQTETQHRIMFMMTGVLFGLAFIQLLFGFYMIISPEFYHNPYLCHTKRCIDLSRRLRETLNRSVNPCEDFYAFVCGSSEISMDLTKEEDEEWNYGFDVGRVTYDFRYSSTLGDMLSKMKTKPSNLVLDMYQACLEEKKRNKLGLQPYYDFLKELDLYDVSPTNPKTANDVVKSMGIILSHSFHTSAILKVIFYRENESSPIKAYIEPAITEPIRAGSVFRYGYKRYHDTIHSALSLMKKELGISDAEMDVLPHDILCLDLYFFQDEHAINEMKEVISDGDNVGQKPCDVGGTSTAPSPNGKFDFDLLIRTMYEFSNPNWDKTSTKTPFGHDFEDSTKDPRTDVIFIKRFDDEFSRSTSLRFVRYLQWRVFYQIAFQLDDASAKIMINIWRHSYLGKITSCFHVLFTWLPFLAPNTFLKNSKTDVKHLSFEFDYIANQTISAYNERARLSIVENMLKIAPGLAYDEKQKKILEKILLTDLRVDTVPPVEFNSEYFPEFHDLYKNLDFDINSHLGNILKMGHRIHEWKTMPNYAHIYYNIDPTYRVPLLFDKSIRNYDRINNRYRIYLPMALAESPFSNDGLQISGLSGLGLEIAGNLETTFYSSLVYLLSQEYLHKQFPSGDWNQVDAIEKHILAYHHELRKRFENQIATYKIGGSYWNNFRYQSALDQITTTALHDQSRYQAMALIADYHLKNLDIPWQERKSVLQGLEEYNLKQIFYIDLVNRRCEKLGPKKYAQIYEYGPLPQSMQNNLALSNLDDFSRAFKCKLGSPMNRKDKVYFWNRNYKVKNIINN